MVFPKCEIEEKIDSIEELKLIKKCYNELINLLGYNSKYINPIEANENIKLRIFDGSLKIKKT